MTNKEAWHKGYVDGFKGLNPRPDYPLVGLAGSYRLGYEAGQKRRKEPKGPRRNAVKPQRRLFNPTITGLKGELLQVDNDIAELETDPFYKETPGRRAYRAKWLAYHRRQRRQLEQLLKTVEKAARQRSNGIVEAAAGLQALEYIGAKAKRSGLGRKAKYNPNGARFLIQIIRTTGGREQFTTNSEKQAKEVAASWFSRGASVVIVDRKKKTQTVYGKKNPSLTAIQQSAVDALLRIRPKGSRGSGARQAMQRKSVLKRYHAAAKKLGYTDSQIATQWQDVKDMAILEQRSNPRAKGSRDALGVFHAENPKIDKAKLLADHEKGKHDQFFEPYCARCEENARFLNRFLPKRRSHKPPKPKNFSRTIWGKKKNNPSVTDLSRTFQGDADGAIDRLYAADGAPANLARAGKLVFLKVKGRTFRLPGAVVAIAPNEKLWITGKPPLFETKARKGEGLDVGEVTHICYKTAKRHIGDGKTFEYVHEFGEDGGRRPRLIIDHEGMPILRGGDYKIRTEGIVN